MKISEGRTILRTAAANAGDSTVYVDAFLDQCQQDIGEDLSGTCDLTEQVTAITLTESDDELPEIHAEFRRERLRGQPYLTGSNVTVDETATGARGLDTGKNCTLEVWTIEELNEQALLNPGVTGQPIAIAFETPGGAGRVFPTPDDDYTLKVPWVAPYSSWFPGIPILAVSIAGSNNHISAVSVISGGSGILTAPTITFSGTGSGATGTATLAAGRIASVAVGGGGGSGYASDTTALVNGHDASDQTLNVPGDYLRRALITGGVALLQFSDLKRRFGSSNWQRYQEFLAELKGQTQAPRRRKLRPRVGWGW